MGIEQTSAGPTAKLVLVNLNADPADTDASRLVAQFNPQSLQENLVVTYARMPIIGGSSRPLQWIGTENSTIPITLFFLARDKDTAEAPQNARRFLQSLAYPLRTANSITTGQPPRVFVSWPNVVSLTTRLVQLQTTAQRFGQSGGIRQLTARCTFEEVRDVRWTSEDALNWISAQTQRPGGLG